ncbi:putative glycoprotein beta-5-like [Homarus americanus]|uniref:Putative glycoprotein beta-5-like n=1 Tax=Homarus americanus TaxID=6706 RepID=A0A8J5K4F7_HOMAM|nr:putative glycoprotein beta-5-like [Homarus americanus]
MATPPSALPAVHSSLCLPPQIADWKFPYKRSHHPVTLGNCEDNAAPGTETYSYHEATRCACSVCKTSEASCEGLRYRGARRAPRAEVPRG